MYSCVIVSEGQGSKVWGDGGVSVLGVGVEGGILICGLRV